MPCAPKVFVVIPVHDRCRQTVSCLDSLLAQTYSHLTVVVVDDGSTDGTGRAITKDYPSVILLNGDGNLWWTGATNLGVEWVLERCSPEDYILTFNNDTTVQPDYVATLLGLAEATKPSLVGSAALDSRDKQTIADGGPMVNWLTAKWCSLNQGRSVAGCLAEGTHFVEPSCLPGRGTLIPVQCFRDVGLFDAVRLPHYAADYEFSLRAKRAGYRLLMSYDASVISDVEATGICSKQPLPGRERFKVFVSRRSPSCFIYRWRFAWLTTPRHVLLPYVLADTGRVVAGALRDWAGR